MKQPKYIIVGQGLAGTLLSYHMYKKGIDHRVIAADTWPSSSKTAAGMYNPMVFKRVTKSWMIDSLLPYLNQVYAEMEQLLGQPFRYPRMIAKLVQPSDISYWQKRIESQQLQPYIFNIDENAFRDFISEDHYIAFIRGGGFINTSLLLDLYRSFLQSRHLYLEEAFDHKKVVATANKVQYNNICATAIIFCEGALAVRNPFFGPAIPFYLTRGDLLQLEIPGFQQEYIFNKDFFLLPVNGQFILGSTYKRISEPDYNLHPAEKQLLISRFEQVIDLPYRIVQHTVGVRPTMKDRRPVLGAHPEYPNLHVFNGLGTKGVMLAPYFAREMLRKLENPNYELNAEIDLTRFL